MMSCLSDQELIECIDEQLTVDRARQAESHLAACKSCEERLGGLRRLAANVASPVVDADGGVFIQETLAAMNREEQRPSQWWKYAVAAAVVLVVAPISFMLLDSNPQHRGMFAARGGSKNATLSRLTGVDVFFVEGERHVALPEKAVLKPSAGLAFRYTNATPHDLYLMAFGVDSRGDLHWFYPAFTDSKTDPVALSIPHSRRRSLLPDTVRPEGCPPGALRIVTMISKQRRSVRQVEKLLAGTTASSPVHGRFTGDQVQELLVKVEASR